MSILAEHPAALPLLMGEDLYIIREKQAYSQFDYLGNNNRYILILVKETKETYLSESDQAFLTKILGAVKLQFEDIALVNVQTHPKVDFTQLKNYFSCTKLLSFGISAAEIGLKNSSLNELHEYQNTKIIIAESLSILAKDDSRKKLLWLTLKKLFNV